MHVVYKENILEKLDRVIVQARKTNKTIDYISVTTKEFDKITQVLSPYVQWDPKTTTYPRGKAFYSGYWIREETLLEVY